MTLATAKLGALTLEYLDGEIYLGVEDEYFVELGQVIKFLTSNVVGLTYSVGMPPSAVVAEGTFDMPDAPSGEGLRLS